MPKGTFCVSFYAAYLAHSPVLRNGKARQIQSLFCIGIGDFLISSQDLITLFPQYRGKHSETAFA